MRDMRRPLSDAVVRIVTCPTCPVQGYQSDMARHTRRCAKAAHPAVEVVRREPKVKPLRRHNRTTDPDYGAALRESRYRKNTAGPRPDVYDDAAYLHGMERTFHAPRSAALSWPVRRLSVEGVKPEVLVECGHRMWDEDADARD